jgi:excisionase family DNA binding protein
MSSFDVVTRLRDHDLTNHDKGPAMDTTHPSNNHQSEETRLLTTDEAAQYLAIPKATLYTWRTRRTGFGPRAVKIGGCLRFRRSDLDSWIEAHVEQPDSALNAATTGAPEESLRGKAPSPLAGVAMTRQRHRRM